MREPDVGPRRLTGCRAFLALRVNAMPLLASLYDQHADECARAAEQAEDPNRRALLLKIADEWRRDAERLRQQALVDRCDGVGRASTEIAPGIRKI
jgi:hypothetical protein